MSAAGRGSEALRKTVHVAMGGFALALRWLTPLQAALCALTALAFNLLLLHRLTQRRLLRDAEQARGFSLGIALYPAVVLALILVFWRRLELAAATWALLAFGDGMATVAGRALGGPRLSWNPGKTWSGLAAFVLYGATTSALLLRWTQWGAIDAAESGAGRSVDWIGLSYFVGPTAQASWIALVIGCTVAALVAGLAESLDVGIDDNILVPLVGGTALWLGTLVDPALVAAAAPRLSHDFAWGAVVNLALALAAYAARGVGVSGAVWGWVLGTTLYGLAGWRGFSMLLAFFVLGTAMTKVGYAKKAALGIAQEKGGRRGARNAFANVGAGVLFAFLALARERHRRVRVRPGLRPPALPRDDVPPRPTGHRRRRLG
jgi:dolichol kinase